jgi:hypothetical protein
MSISRRQFLLATGSSAVGFILPSFYEKALSFIEDYGEPLIVSPPDPKIELFAVDRGGFGYEFNLGDPWCEPPDMTIREFANRYGHGDPEAWYRENWCREEDQEVDLAAQMNYDYVLDFWCRAESPNALAYRLLEDLDLGPSLSGVNAVGELSFIDGPCPGNDYLGVEAADQISISLLQQRLNQLGTGIEIHMG